MKNHETHRALRSTPQRFAAPSASGRTFALPLLTSSALLGALLQAPDARAQEAEPEAAPEEVAQTEATAAPAPVEESPVGREEPPVASAPALNVAAEPEGAPTTPAAEPEPLLKPSLNVGMGIRTGAALIFDEPSVGGPALRLDDGVGNLLNVRPYFSGQLTDAVGFTGNFEVTQGGVAILDAIVQLKVVDEFQIWVGQHIPAMERNNFNGPFYNNGWNLPIVVQTLPFDIAGRDRGVTFWGLVAGGLIKYHASIVDLAAPAATATTEAAGLGNARFAGRVTLNLLDKENYYYTSGTYYGKQDTLAIGAVIQGQKGPDGIGGVDLDNDLLAFTADILFEKNLKEAGTITLEGGYWNFGGTGAAYAPNQGTADFGGGVFGPLGGNASSYLISVSWLTPENVGYGKLQPVVKAQIGDYADTAFALDAGVGYIIDDFNHRWFLNFRHQEAGGGAQPIDMLQIGAQLQL